MLLAPWLMLLVPTAPTLSLLAMVVISVLWVRLTKRYFFWSLASGFWVCFLAFALSTLGPAAKNKKALEDSVPISAQTLAVAVPAGRFLLSGVSLDNSIKGSYRHCKLVLEGTDPPVETERCSSASVTALTRPAKDAGEAVIVGWLVRDRRGWPKFFGDRDLIIPLIVFTHQFVKVVRSKMSGIFFGLVYLIMVLLKIALSMLSINLKV